MNDPRLRRHRRNKPPRLVPILPQGGPHTPLGTLADRCYRQIPRVAIAHGREFFRTGRVSDPKQIGETFTLFVHGGGVNFEVTLDFSQVSVSENLLARCTCPYYQTGGLCKHLWAGILQIDQMNLGEIIPGKGQLKVTHENPRAPGERRVFRPVLPIPGTTRISTTSWMTRLDQIQGNPRGPVTGRILPSSQAYFVINASETIATGKLILDLWSRDRTGNGELGLLRPNKVTTHDLARFADVQEQEILSILSRTGEPQLFTPFSRFPGAVSSRFTVDPLFESYLLPLLAGAGKIFLSRSPNGSPDNAERPLRLDRGNTWELELKIEVASTENYRLVGRLKREGEIKDLREPIYVFRNGFILFSDRISSIADPKHIGWLTELRSPPEFLVPRNQGDTLLKRILTHAHAPKLTWPEDMGWTLIPLDPRPMGIFRALGNDPATGRMTLTVNFDYSGHIISLDDMSRMLVDLEQKRVYPRNFPFEDRTLKRALEILRDRQGTGTLPATEINRAATELSKDGWSIFIENQKLHFTENFAMHVSSGTDWFDLKIQASFGNTEISQSELLNAMTAKNGIVKLSDGSLGMLPQEWLARYESLSKFSETTGDGSLRFSKAQGLMLNAALSETDRIRADSEFLLFREKIQKFEGLRVQKLPKGFKGELRNYQKEGLTWLSFLEEFEVGGILADDMGLGKTIQILAFLQRRKKKVNSPNLVIAPKSLVFNWLDEANKFVPDLKVVRYAGAGRSQNFETLLKADLVVTTYGTLRADIEKLKAIEFDVAIVDEAQAIKNSKSQASRACKILKANCRLALTGTPIENSIEDLFSILEFTSRGLIRFSQEKTLEEDSRRVLSQMIRPFLLRRTKEKVLQELPEKSEQVLYCEMGVKEKTFYSALRDHYKTNLGKKIDQKGMNASRMHILEALLRLRQASCHPGLVDKSMQAESSAKLVLLLNHIKEVIEGGHKALVFSQFTSLLALLRESLDQEEIVYEYLDGKTVNRKASVTRFQSDPDCPLFLISLKAGGIGLNLTAADYVFILDPWWNPSVEAQAIGRAHRIGQDQKVFAYRMIARGTIEEKIIHLQKTKRDLADSIILEDHDFLRKMTREDLEVLLT